MVGLKVLGRYGVRLCAEGAVEGAVRRRVKASVAAGAAGGAGAELHGVDDDGGESKKEKSKDPFDGELSQR